MTTTIQLSVEGLAPPVLRQEIATRFAKQEEMLTAARTKGYFANDEEAAYKNLGAEIDVFQDILGKKEAFSQQEALNAANRRQSNTPAEQMHHALPGAEAGGRNFDAKSLGQMFVESAEYKYALDNGHIVPDGGLGRPIQASLKGFSLLQRVMERRAILVGNSTTSAGAGVINDFQPGYYDLRQRQLTLLDLISRIPTSSDTIDYLTQTAFTNNSAFVAEATGSTGTSGTKPESALDFARVTKPVETLAHYITVTTRALADFAQISAIINGQLMLGVDLALETAIISGNGSTPNLEGILQNSTVQQQSLGTDNTADALFKAMIKVQVTGLAMPNAHVMNPLNWQTVRLARENASTGVLGQYLYGPPSMVGANTLWGLPVVLSLGMTANTAVTADWSMATMALFDREQTTIRTGTINDDFTRNIVRILAEMRAAFALFRPLNVCKVTGLS